MKNLDIFISNAEIVDGTGKNRYMANIGIRNNKIEYIGNDFFNDSKIQINAKNLCLSPGFIDSHSHSDFNIIDDGIIIEKLSQGITTELVGNCGCGLAPINNKYYKEAVKYLTPLSVGRFPNNWENFNSFSYYLNQISKLKLSHNFAFLIGHGNIRISVMGFENRKPTEFELNKMKDIVREAMEQGAFGLSTGLIYPPEPFCDKEELIELCKVVKEYGGIYATHVRNESDYVIEAIEEAISIGREAKIPVCISHHKIAGINNWGKSKQTIALIKSAISEGIDIWLDQYPYDAGSSQFLVLLPPKYLSNGVDNLIKDLNDPQIRKDIMQEMIEPTYNWDNFYKNCGFNRIMIMTADNNKDAIGKTITEYSQLKGKNEFDTLFDLIQENKGNTIGIFFLMCEEDIERILKFEHTLIGTDGVIKDSSQNMHPRSIAAFPRVIDRYVKKRGILTLEEAISKMTYLPAKKIGFKNKGLIKEGYDADIVLFNFESIRDTANYENCHLLSEGIEIVIVNGKIAYKNKKYTESNTGQIIRMQEEL